MHLSISVINFKKLCFWTNKNCNSMRNQTIVYVCFKITDPSMLSFLFPIYVLTYPYNLVGLTLSHTLTHFDTSTADGCWKHCGKRWKCSKCIHLQRISIIVHQCFQHWYFPTCIHFDTSAVDIFLKIHWQTEQFHPEYFSNLFYNFT